MVTRIFPPVRHCLPGRAPFHAAAAAVLLSDRQNGRCLLSRPACSSGADRAPDGFDRIEDALSPAELAGLRDAYRATSLQDVVALNTRPSLQR
jgi:hypothetical protein